MNEKRIKQIGVFCTCGLAKPVYFELRKRYCEGKIDSIELEFEYNKLNSDRIRKGFSWTNLDKKDLNLEK